MIPFLLLSLLLNPPSTPVASWQTLGTCEVKIRAEADVIHVTAAKGVYRKIKLKVRGNAVRFFDLKVHFANGEVHDVPLRKMIPAGGESRVIDLPGNRRVIKNVGFVYKTEMRGGRTRRAVVTLWGMH